MEDLFQRLSHSKFRSSFHLKEKDILYIQEKGFQTIEEHAYQFIRKRIAPRYLIHDGRQTPMKGHPVFIAQHATATCCRGCIYKWHKIDSDKELSEEEVSYLVKVILIWIKREYDYFKKKK